MIEKYNQESKLIITEFNSIILEYNEKCNEIEKNLKNTEEYIYDEYNNLKRLVQLESEIKIENIKQSNEINLDIEDDDLEPFISSLVQSIKNQMELLIIEIEVNEKECNPDWTNKQSNLEEYNHLNKLSNLFIREWNGRMNTFNFNDYQINQAFETLKIFKNKIENLDNQVKNFIFNDKYLELKRFDDSEKNDNNRLDYYLFKKKF